MLRIGEASKLFNISNRTLRYWEEEGIICSARMDNGYRFYDDGNAARIRQIVLLRKLRMPIADIERVMVSCDVDVAINALIRHLERLKMEESAARSIIQMTEKLIQRMTEKKEPALAFAYPGMQNDDAFSEQKYALQSCLSEGGIALPTNQLKDVRIVRLPAMTVASYRAESETPERDCSEVMNRFIMEHSLHQKSGFRHFGFNNPSPVMNNPVYGYEIWTAVPEDFRVPEPLTKKQFDGGLYASIPARLGEIGERWMQLYNWAKNHDRYDVNCGSQWLEECVDFESLTGDENNLQLDLLEPIRLK